MAVIGELATLITARTEPFSNGLKSAGLAANSFTGTIKGKLGGALGGLSGMLNSATAALVGLGGAITAGGLIAKSIKMASAAEDMETAYATYLKSMEKAKSVLGELQKYSASTPFESIEIKEAGKQLLAFGFQAEKLMDVMYVLGDLAAGSQKPMADFVDILGKIKAGGVASMGDINRLADRGVPIFQELAKVMGVASSEVRTLVGSSQVGFNEVWASLKNVVGEGGLFQGAVAKLAETTSGKLSTLKDNINTLFTDVGRAILEGLDLKVLTERVTDLVATYKGSIVDATTSGVELILGATAVFAETVQEIKKWIEGWSYLYHGMMDKYWSTVDWLGNTLPGAAAPDARRNALEHRAAMYEAQIAGSEITRQQYLRAGSAARPAQQPSQPVTQQQRAAQTQAEAWALHQARRQDELTKLQLREQQRTNQILQEQALRQQWQMQLGIVDHF